MKKAVGNLYHVVNRGVDKRKIFLNDKDYFRFIHDLFEFNNTEQTINFYRIFSKNDVSKSAQLLDVGRPTIRQRDEPRKILVEILAFCLMPNHYHLLLRPKRENGLENFIKKINGGYAKYFNNKYERVGALFQGKYRSVLVKDEAHFIHLPYYIHLNPVDLMQIDWRSSDTLSTSDVDKIERYLGKYRWSSYLDYIGKKNFPSVTQREFLLDFYKGSKNYKKELFSWLKTKELEGIKTMFLE